MNCIFCKELSDHSKSVEHIIPESLGNKNNVLPKGIVCDTCNNYFSVKIEKPLLELPYFISVRYRNEIRNKKREVPKDTGVVLTGDGGKIRFYKDKEGKPSIILDDDNIENSLLEATTFSIIMPINDEPPFEDRIISKFLGKISIEAMAQIFTEDEERLNEIVFKEGLDRIRNYVRFGGKPEYWPCHCRRVYPENFVFLDSDGQTRYCINHNYKFIQTSDTAILFVLELFGREYCIDITEPTTERYCNWLKEHNGARPLDGLGIK